MTFGFHFDGCAGFGSHSSEPTQGQSPLGEPGLKPGPPHPQELHLRSNGAWRTHVPWKQEGRVPCLSWLWHWVSKRKPVNRGHTWAFLTLACVSPRVTLSEKPFNFKQKTNKQNRMWFKRVLSSDAPGNWQKETMSFFFFLEEHSFNPGLKEFPQMKFQETRADSQNPRTHSQIRHRFPNRPVQKIKSAEISPMKFLEREHF